MNHLTATPDQPILPVWTRTRRVQGRLAALVATTDSPLPTLLRVTLGGLQRCRGAAEVIGGRGGGQLGFGHFLSSWMGWNRRRNRG